MTQTILLFHVTEKFTANQTLRLVDSRALSVSQRASLNVGSSRWDVWMQSLGLDQTIHLGGMGVGASTMMFPRHQCTGSAASGPLWKTFQKETVVPALPQTTTQPGQPEESSISATPAVAAWEVAAELMGAHSPRSSSSTPSRCLVVSQGANSGHCWRGLHQESRRERESGSWHTTARTSSVVHLR